MGYSLYVSTALQQIKKLLKKIADKLTLIKVTKTVSRLSMFHTKMKEMEEKETQIFRSARYKITQIQKSQTDIDNMLNCLKQTLIRKKLKESPLYNNRCHD